MATNSRAYQSAWRAKNREKIRQQQRDWYREKHGSLPRGEYLAKLAKERDEKERATHVAKQHEKAIRKALQAQERAILCGSNSGNGTKPCKASNSTAALRPKPGRICALSGWLNW